MSLSTTWLDRRSWITVYTFAARYESAYSADKSSADRWRIGVWLTVSYRIYPQFEDDTRYPITAPDTMVSGMFLLR